MKKLFDGHLWIFTFIPSILVPCKKRLLRIPKSCSHCKQMGPKSCLAWQLNVYDLLLPPFFFVFCFFGWWGYFRVINPTRLIHRQIHDPQIHASSKSRVENQTCTTRWGAKKVTKQYGFGSCKIRRGLRL